MKHLMKFEDLEYKDILAQEADLRIQKEKILEERQELTHVVVQSLIYSELNKPGFENFKEDLKNLLAKYPTEQLPKSGTSIYRSLGK